MNSKTAFTLVSTDGSPGYRLAHDPHCLDSQRFMAVHRVDGGGWGIVDRRTGRLLHEARPNQHRYPGWHDVLTVVETLNGRGSE